MTRPGVLCCAFLTLTTSYASSELEGRLVRKLSLESDGPLKRISEGDIYKLIEVKEGQSYRRGTVRNSILRLHGTHLFHDVQVKAAPAEAGRVDVTFLLVRRFVIREVQFEGKVGLEVRQLRRELALREGEPYSNVLMEETLARLQALYRRHGYYQARLHPSFEQDHKSAELKVRITVEAGARPRVARLDFDVEQGVHLDRIRSLIKTRPEALYSEAQWTQDLQVIERFLVSQGYLKPEIYLKDGEQYDPTRNTVSLTLRIVPREQTKLELQGVDGDRDQIGDLIFQGEEEGRELFLEETLKRGARRYQEHLQQQGYFLADVDTEVSRSSEGQNQIAIHTSQGKKYSLAQLAFEGNHFAEEASLRRLVTVEQAGWFGRGRFSTEAAESDVNRIQSYYQQRGYLDAKVSYQIRNSNANSDDLILVFKIEEGSRYQIGQLEIVGNAQVDTQTLRREVQSGKGKEFSPLLLAQDRASLIAAYENRGYRRVDLRTAVSFPQPGRAHVAYFIQEGRQSRVEHVIVTGNRVTRESVIRREVEIEPGAPLSLDQMLRTETNLYDLAVFSKVQVSDVPSYQDPHQRTVLINVEEAKKYTLLYGIGYSSLEGMRGTLGITNSNLWGMARALTLGARVGQQRQRGNISYTIPRPFEWKFPTILSFTADNERRLTETTKRASSVLRGRPFDAFRLIASSQSERRLSRRESLFFRFNFENVRLDVPEALAEPLEFFREEKALRLSHLSLSYINESRDDPTNPRRGFFLTSDAQLSTRLTGSQKQFHRILLQGQYYRKLAPDLILASSLRIGVITPFGETAAVQRRNPIPISERFFAGGSTTLRGLPQDLAGPLLRDQDGKIVLVDAQGRAVDKEGKPIQEGRPVPLGGNGLLMGNLELRFPLVGFVSGALFYDVGNVFRSITDISSAGVSNALGLGVRVNTPVGPLRFDAGYNPEPPQERNPLTGTKTVLPGFKHWNFHFTLGHTF